MKTEKNKRYFVEGYALIFDSLSENIGGFREIIHKGAITQELVDNSDVFVRMDHDNQMILARSKNGEGSLQLTLDDKGLKYRFEVPEFYRGKEIVAHLRRKEITKSSFCFRVSPEKGSEHWEYDETIDFAVRHIYKIDGLYDVAPVYNPAYEETTCYLVEENINIDDIQNEE